MPSTETKKVDSEKVNSTSSMERANSDSNSKNNDESFVHLGRVLVNLTPEKEKTIFGNEHSVTMQLYRLHQVPQYLHIKSSSSSSSLLTRAEKDVNGSDTLTNNVKWYTPWNWWRLLTSPSSSTNKLPLPSTSEAASGAKNAYTKSTNQNLLQYNRADQTKSTGKVESLLQELNDGEYNNISTMETEEDRMRIMAELDEMYDELNETYLTNPDLHDTNKENKENSITAGIKKNKKKGTDTQVKDKGQETLNTLADEKTHTSFASSMLEKEPITKEKQQKESNNYKSSDNNNEEEKDAEEKHNKTNIAEVNQKAKKRRQLPEITIGPLTDQQVEDELTESVRNDRTQMLTAEEQIHTTLSTIEKTRMRYLVPSTLLQCEEELNAVTKCYEVFNARKRSELMANMNKTHHNIHSDSDISNNSSNKDNIMNVKNQILTQAELLKCAPLAKSLRRCVDLTLSRYSSHDDTEEDDKLSNNKENNEDGSKKNSNSNSNSSNTNVNNKN